MAARLPIPEDFPEYARILTTSELMDRYGVKYHMVRKWRQKFGIKPVIKRKSNGEGKPFPKTGPRLDRGIDPPEKIQICLNCPMVRCKPTNCLRLKGGA